MTEGVFKARPRKLKGSSKGIDKLNARRRRVLSRQIGKRDNEIKFEKDRLDKYGNTKLDKDRYQGKIDLKKKSKSKLQKKLDTVPKTMRSSLGKKLSKGLGKGGVGSIIASLVIAYPELKEIIGGSINDERAKELLNNKDGTSKEYRKKIGEAFKNLPSDIIENPADLIKNILIYSNPVTTAGGILGIFDNQVADATLDFPSSKKRPVQKTAKLEDLSPSQLRQYRNTLGGFGNITEERRKINKLLKGKKKGGKVIKSKTKKNKKIGRPKGVGCATRGYGKAMKRGK